MLPGEKKGKNPKEVRKGKTQSRVIKGCQPIVIQKEEKRLRGGKLMEA